MGKLVKRTTSVNAPSGTLSASSDFVESFLTRRKVEKDLLVEGREITAILSKSHKTARDNRRRKKNRSMNQMTNLPNYQLQIFHRCDSSSLAPIASKVPEIAPAIIAG